MKRTQNVTIFSYFETILFAIKDGVRLRLLQRAAKPSTHNKQIDTETQKGGQQQDNNCEFDEGATRRVGQDGRGGMHG